MAPRTIRAAAINRKAGANDGERHGAHAFGEVTAFTPHMAASSA